MFYTKALTFTNFTIATTALCFQVFALYPWHNKLDDEFKRLKEEHKQLLLQFHELKLSKLGEINNKLNKILIEVETKNK
ncbi:hypothetical protein K492DRAFT_139165 [Lichtheimia hyalospora FSU 10163]|nr:hypothetical protein K492DRAFT_139165 [Lichtheimia hyalospora FSU 10163]